MYIYLLIVIVQIIILFVYFKIANRLNIIDKPNERSSHSYITIRGGGIIFPVAALLWFFIYGFNYSLIIIALLTLAAVSFIDDIITLTSKFRMLIHLAAVTALFLQLGVFDFQWYVIVLVYLICVGWINAFNFMDGINGITAIYSIIALGSFTWLNQSIQFLPQHLINYLIFSVLIFSYFNLRKKAKTFAGDVGSVSMAFILAWFMISLIINTGRIEYILFFAVYGIDTVFTIFYRMKRRENIFEAHRSHLYQYLSNELKWSHVLVSAIYGIVQIVINIITIALIFSGNMNWLVFILFLLLLAAGYLILRHQISGRIRLLSY